MDWIEVTGKTVEEASEKALDLLGVADDDAEIEVLAEPKMGLFGRLREEGRVRARVRPEVPRPKDDRSRKRRNGGRPPRDEAPAPAAAAAAPVVAEPTTDEADPGGAAPRPRSAGGPRESRRSGVAVADQRSTREGTMDEDAVEVPVAEQAQVAKEFVDGLLAIMAIDDAASEVVLIDDETAELQVTGADLGLLIGPKGATLLALQDLARTVVQRRTGARTGRLLLDVAGYRQKRKEALERFTHKVAQEVLSTGSPTAMEPMSSADRKIVHDTVNAIEGVATTSEGEDPRRHVVVRPA